MCGHLWTGPSASRAHLADVRKKLLETLDGSRPAIDTCQDLVDEVVSSITDIIQSTSSSHGKLRCRKSGKSVMPKGGRIAAPPELRGARWEARQAKTYYLQRVRKNLSPSTIREANSNWNRLSAVCRFLSSQARSNRCLSWNKF